MSESDIQLVVVGSVGIDTIETPEERREEILGGSASYACAAASFFTKVGMVGVVGTDFPEAYRQVYRHFQIDLDGLQTVDGKTFRWSGIYEANMDNRHTVSTELNVFASFMPNLPEAYRKSPFLFLGNISPQLQLHVLGQIEKPRFVVIDTMDLWIDIARPDLLKVIQRTDMITINEFEARHLSGHKNLLKAAQILLCLGPRFVLVKKGENGSALFCKDSIFLLPAFPGAGDVFAGGVVGSLAAGGEVSEKSIRQAMIYGSIVASFGVEAFSLERLQMLTRGEIDTRADALRRMLQL